MTGRAQVIRFLFVLIAIGTVAVAASQRETITATAAAGCATLLAAMRLGPPRCRDH